MNRVSLCRILCVAVLYSLTVHAFAAEANGVSFEPSPGADWQCTLTNDDLPGLAAEGMTRPIASGCARGSARAYVVIVDLSSSRSAMSADQMAADAEEQLPSNWKIESKQYEVLTLENGRDAAYSKLTGKGDGFTFATGNSAMVSISANVPLLFEDNQSAAHQAIAVFRIRAPLPAQGRKTLLRSLIKRCGNGPRRRIPPANRSAIAHSKRLPTHAIAPDLLRPRPRRRPWRRRLRGKLLRLNRMSASRLHSLRLRQAPHRTISRRCRK